MCGVPVWSVSVCAVFQLARQHFRRLAAAACAAGWTVPGSASEPPALCSEPDGAPRTHSGNARLAPEHTHTYVMKVFSMQVCVCFASPFCSSPSGVLSSDWPPPAAGSASPPLPNAAAG